MVERLFPTLGQQPQGGGQVVGVLDAMRDASRGDKRRIISSLWTDAAQGWALAVLCACIVFLRPNTQEWAARERSMLQDGLLVGSMALVLTLRGFSGVASKFIYYQF